MQLNIFRFSELFSAAIRENGTLCLSIFRLLEEDIDNDGDIDQVSTIKHNICIIIMTIIMTTMTIIR